MRPRTTDTCPLHAGQRSDGPLFLGGCCAAAACGCGVRLIFWEGVQAWGCA
jgi:hypothetical protein